MFTMANITEWLSGTYYQGNVQGFMTFLVGTIIMPPIIENQQLLTDLGM